MTRIQRRPIAIPAILALLCAVLFAARANGVTRSVILRLHAAAQQQYADNGGIMNRYNVVVYRGKAYATTRGTVNAVPTIAVWEYVPPDWHRIFDYPFSDAHSREVSMHYRSYGFSARMQKRLLAKVHPFP